MSIFVIRTTRAPITLKSYQTQAFDSAQGIPSQLNAVQTSQSTLPRKAQVDPRTQIRLNLISPLEQLINKAEKNLGKTPPPPSSGAATAGTPRQRTLYDLGNIVQDALASIDHYSVHDARQLLQPASPLPVKSAQDVLMALRALPPRPSLAQAILLRNQFNQLKALTFEAKQAIAKQTGATCEIAGAGLTAMAFNGITLTTADYKRLQHIRRLCHAYGAQQTTTMEQLKSFSERYLLCINDLQELYNQACMQQATREHKHSGQSITDHTQALQQLGERPLPDHTFRGLLQRVRNHLPSLSIFKTTPTQI